MLRIPFLRGSGDTATDPVCNMEVNVKNPNGGTHDHNGQTYYFCAPGLPHSLLQRAGSLPLRREEDRDVARGAGAINW